MSRTDTIDAPASYSATKKELKKSNTLFSDIRNYLYKKPDQDTLIRILSEEDRLRYTQSIRQRTGIGVEKYRMLNIHRIGIDAPAAFIFDEIMKWNGLVDWWPNHIARVHLEDNKLDDIKIYLFGRIRISKKLILGFKLFNLKAITIRRTPGNNYHDNARYLLYECSGGYPIGVFSMYVRSAISEFGEKEATQLFMVVGFNFYGRQSWSSLGFLKKAWERIHNRVTANVLDRFRKISEARFEEYRRDWSNHEERIDKSDKPTVNR